MNNKTVFIQQVLDRYSDILQRTTERIDDALINIKYQKADAALVEPAIAQKFMAKCPEVMRLDVPLDAPDCVHGMGLAIKKENTALAQQVEAAVVQLQQHGFIAAAAQQWNIS
jgi:ABC-type amino acid transport substrate-binding protein